MDIYYGMDGTDNNDKVTDPIGSTSFVKRICGLGFDRYKYEPGTTLTYTGRDSGRMATDAVKLVMGKLNDGKASLSSPHRIFLGGFSRGGASAIYAAKLLGDQGVLVKGLFLFDAVDRTLFVPSKSVQKIPANVSHAYHAYRAEIGASRRWFGNCGREGIKGNLTLKSFHTTHGAMGGWRLGSERLAFKSEYLSDDAANAQSTPSISFSKSVFAERGSLTKTNVTAIQQLSSSLAVWNWMEERVRNSLQRP